MNGAKTPLIYVTVRDGAGNSERVIDLHRVKKLEYTDSQKQADKCVITVDNFDLSNFDDPIWAHGNIVTVSWGYVGNLSLTRECLITKVTGFTDLKVEARARSVLLDTEKKSRTFRNMSRAEIVAKIAKEYGYNEETLHIEDTGKRLGAVTQGALSDAQFLKKLAHQQGFEWFVDQDGLHFHAMKIDQVPLREFIYYTDPGYGDVISINVETDITRVATEVKKKGKDPATKQTIESKAVPEGQQSEVLLVAAKDLRSGKTVYKGEILKTVLLSGKEFDNKSLVKDRWRETALRPPHLYAPVNVSPVTSTEAEHEGPAKLKKSQSTAVKITITAVGDPTMNAKTVIVLRCNSKRLTGNYYVREVTHSVDPGAYTMKLKVTSDGLSAGDVKETGKLESGIPSVGGSGKATGKAPASPDGRASLLTNRDPNALEPIPVVDWATGRVVGTGYRPKSARVIELKATKELTKAELTKKKG
jgi:phage protein D